MRVGKWVRGLLLLLELLEKLQRAGELTTAAWVLEEDAKTEATKEEVNRLCYAIRLYSWHRLQHQQRRLQHPPRALRSAPHSAHFCGWSRGFETLPQVPAW